MSDNLLKIASLTCKTAILSSFLTDYPTLLWSTTSKNAKNADYRTLWCQKWTVCPLFKPHFILRDTFCCRVIWCRILAVTARKNPRIQRGYEGLSRHFMRFVQTCPLLAAASCSPRLTQDREVTQSRASHAAQFTAVYQP